MKEFLRQNVDHKNTETFDQEDLERLFQHATKDLDELDRQHENEFKEYERRATFAGKKNKEFSFIYVV